MRQPVRNWPNRWDLGPAATNSQTWCDAPAAARRAARAPIGQAVAIAVGGRRLRLSLSLA